MPTEVPLWMAKVLHQRQLAQIQLPEWLHPTRLAQLLSEEKQSTLLTQTLPFYYFEMARSLSALVEPSTRVLLQDLTQVRVDKIRRHFHELSRTDLQQTLGELPMISVTGIASVELVQVGPFLQRAFSDYGYLTQRPIDESDLGEKENNASSQESTANKSRMPMAKSRLRRFRS